MLNYSPQFSAVDIIFIKLVLFEIRVCNEYRGLLVSIVVSSQEPFYVHVTAPSS